MKVHSNFLEQILVLCYYYIVYTRKVLISRNELNVISHPLQSKQSM